MVLHAVSHVKVSRFNLFGAHISLSYYQQCSLNIITHVLSNAIYFVVLIRLSMALNWEFMMHLLRSICLSLYYTGKIYLSPTLSLFLRTLKLRIIPDRLHSYCTCKVWSFEV